MFAINDAGEYEEIHTQQIDYKEKYWTIQKYLLPKEVNTSKMKLLFTNPMSNNILLGRVRFYFNDSC